MSGRIEALIDADRWVEARKEIRKELERTPDDHWLLTRLALTFYEERRYADALDVSKKAYAIAPNCPLVVWDYAGALDMCDRRRDAIILWEGLLKRGVDSVAFDECGEGIRWAKSLLNDCRFRIAKGSLLLGDFGRAHEMIALHISHRRPGLPSAYSLKDARSLSKRIQDEQRV